MVAEPRLDIATQLVCAGAWSRDRQTEVLEVNNFNEWM